MRVTAVLFVVGAVLPSAMSRQIPDALQSFYDLVKDGHCPHTLRTNLHKNADSRDVFRYCTDDSEKLMWLSGPSSLGDMDVDCDGANNAYGACQNDPTGQSITAFQDEVSSFGIEDLDANLHSYVVLGTGRFDPRDEGVHSLSVVAVVCGGQLVRRLGLCCCCTGGLKKACIGLAGNGFVDPETNEVGDDKFYGVWGDSNADDLVGEASLSLATACYGNRMNGNSGHSDTDVLYLAFRTDEAFPGRNASWTARDFATFEDSLSGIGDAMLAKYLPGGSGSGSGSGGGSGSGDGGKGGDGGDEDTGFAVQAPGIWKGNGRKLPFCDNVTEDCGQMWAE